MRLFHATASELFTHSKSITNVAPQIAPAAAASRQECEANQPKPCLNLRAFEMGLREVRGRPNG